MCLLQLVVMAHNKLYILTHEFGASIYGGAGTVVNEQVRELRARNIDITVVVWTVNYPDALPNVQQDAVKDVVYLSWPSEILSSIPKDAVVVDHLYIDHPFRRQLPNRIMYEHGLNGWNNSTRPLADRYQKAKAVVCVSEAEANLFKHYFPEMAQQVEVVHNGFTLPYLIVPGAAGQGFGYLGRNVPHKRADFVYRATKELSLQSRFAFATKGLTLPVWSSEVDYHENLTPQEQDNVFWPNLGVLCVPSSYEPFGMVVLEALSRGIPVIAANTGGLAEIVTPTCGILFDSDGLTEEQAYDAFKTALVQWQGLRAGERYMMSVQALNRAKAFSAAKMIDSLIDVIHRRCDHTDFLPNP